MYMIRLFIKATGHTTIINQHYRTIMGAKGAMTRLLRTGIYSRGQIIEGEPWAVYEVVYETILSMTE